MSTIELSNVEALQSLLHDFLKDANQKMKSLEAKKSKLVKKLIGLRFNMEDCKLTTLEVQKTFNVATCEVEHF